MLSFATQDVYIIEKCTSDHEYIIVIEWLYSVYSAVFLNGMAQLLPHSGRPV